MRAVTSLVLVAAVGCAAEPTLSETTQGVATSNKIAVNKIAINKIAINKIAINKIAINKIAINKIAINAISTADLLNSPDCDGTNEDACGGRDVLEYLISCAFPAGTTLVGTADTGVTYHFAGSIGLAPQWETRRLTLGEQRWVSACMLARVNNAGHELFISLRGPHPALAATAEEQDEYDLEEGAFYGDIFTEPQRYYACRGADLYAGDFSESTLLRACAQPTEAGDETLCGMTYAGECGAFEVERACASRSGDHYVECHTTPSQGGGWHDNGIADRFEEAITVYVKTL